MGKLKELWEELKHQKDGARKTEIQIEINNIEKWMIENNIGSIKTVTNWNVQKSSKPKKKFRYESEKMGMFGMPEGALTGWDRCGACRYNNHTWCDNGKTKECIANV